MTSGGKPDLGAHDRDLLEHLRQTVEGALLLELALEVADHAARHLVRVDLHVRERSDAALPATFLPHLLEVLGHLEQLLEVEAAVVGRPRERGDDHLSGRLRVAEGERHGGGVDDVDAGLDGLEVGHRSQPADVVAVQLDRDLELRLQAADELLGVERREQRRHVLDADGVGAHVDEPVRDVHVVVKGVHRRDRVDDGALEVLAGLLDRRGGGLVVADVVEGVEDAEDVHAVLRRLVDEPAHDVVAVVTVADEVLAAQQHLQRRAHDVLLDEAQALPRVLVQEAQRRVEGGAAPALERVEADGVHELEDGDHLGRVHPRRPQRLVPVPEGRVGDAYLARAHGVFPGARSGAAEVLPASSVDLDLLALLDEQRHLDDGARLERSRLGGALGGVSLHARV